MTPEIPPARFMFHPHPIGEYSDAAFGTCTGCRDWVRLSVERRLGLCVNINHPSGDDRNITFYNAFNEDIFDS